MEFEGKDIKTCICEVIKDAQEESYNKAAGIGNTSWSEETKPTPMPDVKKIQTKISRIHKK